MDALEYHFVKRRVLALTGIDLDCYKSPQMQRRLQSYLARSGYPNWATLFRAIQNDPQAQSQLRDYLTINVSYFFRDPDKYRHLQETILPELLRGHPKLWVWSAGCSRGHEPYSLAMVLAELTGPYRPHQLLATDLDHSALAWAQAGGPYTEDETASIPPGLRERYFQRRNDRYWAAPLLQRRITFCRHNLLAEPFLPPGTPEGGYDLIVCRNVVIYFTSTVKEKLYRHFHTALRPGGVLFVGGTEIVSHPCELGFEAMGMCFYRRRAGPASPDSASPRADHKGV